MAGTPLQAWRVKFRIHYLYPEPGMPDILLQLQEALGVNLLNMNNEPGVLSILLRVSAPDEKAAKERALNLLKSAIGKMAVGTPAITDTEVSSDARPPS